MTIVQTTPLTPSFASSAKTEAAASAPVKGNDKDKDKDKDNDQMQMRAPTASELYHFDTLGYVMIEHAIPADRLQRLQATMRRWDGQAQGEQPRHVDPDFRVPRSGAHVRAKMMHPVMKDDDCSWLLANPRLLPLIDALVPNVRFKSSWADWKGRGGGQEHHSNHTPYCHADNYSFQNRICASLVTVCYAIEDIADEGGALELIPGSHKANFPLPDDAAQAAMRLRIPPKSWLSNYLFS